MAVIETAAVVLHVLFAGLWAGAVVLYAWRVHPALADGALAGGAADRVLDGLQWLTRLGAVVFLATGGYLAGAHFDGAALLGTAEGQLVLAMIALWVVLVALLEVATGRLRGTDDGLAAAAREATTLVRFSGVVALALLVVGGLVAAV